MRDRLLSKGLTSDIPEPERTSERRSLSDPTEEDFESEREAEILLRTRIPETLQTIGDHLDRSLATLQRMERRLEELTR
jgi:hypothetical protein